METSFPPQIKRNCQLILYDLNTSDPELTKRCLLKYYCRKLFTNNEDLHKLIFMNSSVTSNRLNLFNDNFNFFGIWEAMDRPSSYDNPELVDQIINTTQPGDCDWLDAIYVAVKSLLDDFNECGIVVTLQLIFLTDFIGLAPTRRRHLLPEIFRLCQDKRVFVYVIGPETTLPITITDLDSIRYCVNNFIIRIPTNGLNVVTLKELIKNQRRRGFCCNYKLGLNIVETLKVYKGTEQWNTPMVLTDQVQISCQSEQFLKEEMPCKLTKNTIWVDSQNEGLRYHPGDIIKGVERFGKFVPIENEERFNVETLSEFTILGFFRSAEIPEHYIGGKGTHLILPYGSDYEKTLFYILVDTLLGQNMYIVARRVFSNNNEAKFVVIMPQSFEPKCLLLSELPYRHQTFHNHNRESIHRFTQMYHHSPRNALVYNYLDSMKYTRDDNVDKFPLRLDLIQDPNSERIINKAADKLLGRDLRLGELDLNYLEVNTGSPVALNVLKQYWPEREFHFEDDGADDSEDD